MATRKAKSLVVLGEEVRDLSPLTTLYFYDNTTHVDSDHDPNPAGVVCALDIMAGHGLDLAALAEQILQRRNPDLKYIIYNRRIASAASGWKWREYFGKNPHTDHIHVSVGVGPDGYSRQPYDDTDKWLEDSMNADEMRAVVVQGIHSALDQAANRNSATGRQMGDDIKTLQSPLLTAIEKIPTSNTVVLTQADKADIARLVAEELRGWSFLPAPKE